MSARAIEMPSVPLLPRTAWMLISIAATSLMGWAIFSRVPPMAVRVGRTLTEATAPLGYQLSVFPVFGALLGALAFDTVRARDRRSSTCRMTLVAATGLLAVARLTGCVPLSGHALFLVAVLGYEVAAPADGDAAVTLTLVIPSLLVVGWYKLVVWGDPWWFCASAAVGATLGAVLARIARA